MRNRKHKPYGWQGDKGYCHCDRFSESKTSKGAEREKAKKTIRKEREEAEG